jgi:hypothetical protein
MELPHKETGAATHLHTQILDLQAAVAEEEWLLLEEMHQAGQVGQAEMEFLLLLLEQQHFTAAAAVVLEQTCVALAA